MTLAWSSDLNIQLLL